MKDNAQTKEGWHVIDAKSATLGRIATQAASLLLGKHLPNTRRESVADTRVILINSDELKVTGNKLKQKTYAWHSRYPGGLKQRTLEEQMRRDSKKVLRDAVSGMLPKNGLRKERLRHLFIYEGSKHPHMAQTNTSQEK